MFLNCLLIYLWNFAFCQSAVALWVTFEKPKPQALFKPLYIFSKSKLFSINIWNMIKWTYFPQTDRWSKVWFFAQCSYMDEWEGWFSWSEMLCSKLWVQEAIGFAWNKIFSWSQFSPQYWHWWLELSQQMLHCGHWR